MNININIMDTVRERDGLAMSSRNAYLTAEEREKAPIVYKALCAAREVYESRYAGGSESVDAHALQEAVTNVLETEPLISEVQYVAVDDLDTMQPLSKVGNDGGIVSLACMLGTVRLIDNIVLR
jgi:pantoate--beta-alanine ligase